MSYYYNYYIGYESHGKLYPLGPYDSKGILHDVVSRSSSFASELHEQFEYVPDEMVSDELRAEFSYKNWRDEDEIRVKYEYLANIPEGSFIRKGYFLINDVKRYENSEDKFDFDGFYDTVEPVVYAAMLQHEIQFGHPKPEKDEFGNEYRVKSASDYMYYAFQDYKSKDYEAFLIHRAAYNIGSFNSNLPEGYKLVVLETEG